MRPCVSYALSYQLWLHESPNVWSRPNTCMRLEQPHAEAVTAHPQWIMFWEDSLKSKQCEKRGKGRKKEKEKKRHKKTYGTISIT